MQVGDLVRECGYPDGIGIVTHVDPEEIGDLDEVLVLWNDGDLSNHSVCYLEVISASR